MFIKKGRYSQRDSKSYNYINIAIIGGITVIGGLYLGVVDFDIDGVILLLMLLIVFTALALLADRQRRVFFAFGDPLVDIADKNLKDSRDFWFGPSAIYYPVSEMTTYPLLSIKNLINNSTIINTSIFMGLAWVILGSEHTLSLLLMAATSLLVNYIIYMPANIAKTHKSFQMQKFNSKPLVVMQYSQKYISKKIKDCDLKVATEAIKDLELHELLLSAVAVSRNINDLIARREIDHQDFLVEIEALNYIINRFIIDTARETNRFFTENSNSKQTAMKAFYSKPYSDLREKIYVYNNLITKLETALYNVQRDLDNEIAKEILREDARKNGLAGVINIAEGMASLFPEYASLEFNRLENKILAEKLVTESLPKLNDALEDCLDVEQRKRVIYAISRIKSFIKSIAKDTPESYERDLRLQSKEEEDLLHIGTNQKINGDIDRMIDIEKRYLDAYDANLPQTKRGDL